MVGYENIIKYDLSTGERFVLSEDKGYSESELYKFNLSTAEGKKISSSFKGNDSYSLIKGLSFVDKKTIMISSYATTSTVNMVVKGYRFDLQKEKVIVWDHVNNYFIIIDLESEFEPLKIILSDDVSIHFNLEPVIKQFEEEYNCPIHITEYTKDVYDDKLRTKILANDKDFDIFITSKPTENNLLASILNHKLYEPLNNYSNIVDNFSYMYTGIEEMMTYNGDLFAIPYYIQIYSTAAVNYDVSQYGYNFPGKHWSLNDLWDLCDNMIQNNEENVSVFGPSRLTLFIDDFVQEAINQDYFDKTQLIDLLEKVKKFGDAEVLYDSSNEKEHIMDELYMYFDAFVSASDLVEYPDTSVYMLQNYLNNHFLKLNYQNIATAAIIFSIIIYLIVTIVFVAEKRMSDEIW